MAFGLPLVGAEVVLLGASVFNRDSSRAAAQLYRLDIASRHLERNSNGAISAITGSSKALARQEIATKALTAAQRQREKVLKEVASLEESAFRASESTRKASVAVVTSNLRVETTARQVSKAIRDEALAQESLGAAQAKQVAKQEEITALIQGMGAGNTRGDAKVIAAQEAVSRAFREQAKAQQGVISTAATLSSRYVVLSRAQDAVLKLEAALADATKAGAPEEVRAAITQKLTNARKGLTVQTNALTSATASHNRAVLTEEGAAANVASAQRKAAQTVNQFDKKNTDRFRTLVTQEAELGRTVNVAAAGTVAAQERISNARGVATAATIRSESATATESAALVKQSGIVTAHTGAIQRLVAAEAELAAAQAEVKAADASVTFSAMAKSALVLITRLAGIAAVFGVISAGLALFASNTDRDLKFVQGITGATKEEIDALAASTQQQALRTGKPFSQLLEGSTEAIKAGVSVKDTIDGIGEAIANLSVASKGELEPAAAGKFVALLVNRYGLLNDATKTAAERQDIIRKAIDATTAAVQVSSLSYQGFAEAQEKVGPIASALNLSVEETAQIIGTVGKFIDSGSEAGTTLQRVFTKLVDPSKEARKAAEKYGVSLFDANEKARPFRDVLVDLQKAFGDTSEEVATDADRLHALQTIFDVRGIRGALALLNGGVEAFDKIGEKSKEISTGAIAEEQIDTSIAQVGRLTQEFSRLGREVGGNFDPSLKGALKTATAFTHELSTERIGQFFDRIGRGTQVLISFAKGSSTVSAVLTGIAIAATVRATPALIRMGVAATAAFVKSAASALTAAAAFAIANAPLVILAITAAAVAKVIIDNWDDISAKFKEVADTIGNTLHNMTVELDKFLANFNLNIKDLFIGILDTIDKITSTPVGAALFPDLVRIRKGIKDLVDALGGDTSSAEKAIASIDKALSEGNLGEAATAKLTEAKKQIEDIFNEPWANIINIPDIDTDTAKQVSDLINSTEAGFEDSASDTEDAVQRMWDEIIETQDRAHDKLLDAQKRDADEERDVREQSFSDELDERERHRRLVQDVIDKGIKDRQDAEMAALKAQQDAESEARDRAKQEQELRNTFEETLSIPRQRVEDAATELERNAAKIRLAHAEKLAQKELDLDEEKLQKEFAAADEENAFKAQQLAAQQALQDKFDAENEARKAQRDAEDLAASKQREQELSDFKKQLAAEERAEQEKLDDEEFERRKQRARDEAEFKKRLGKEFPDITVTVSQDTIDRVNEIINQIKALPELNGGEVPSFASGGIVPGPRGMPRLVIAHGGEEFLGIHNTPLTSVRASEVSGSTSSVVNNYYNYELNASYKDIQTPATLKQDLRAVIELTRR